MRINKQEQAIVDLSVTVLRVAPTASDHVPINTHAIWLALRCLLPHCTER